MTPKNLTSFMILKPVADIIQNFTSSRTGPVLTLSKMVGIEYGMSATSDSFLPEEKEDSSTFLDFPSFD